MSIPRALYSLAALLGIALALWQLAPVQVSTSARLALLAFSGATIAWIATPLSAGFVALAAALFLVLSGAVDQHVLLSALGAEIVWLMIGAFILGKAIAVTGLAARATRRITARERRVDHLFFLVSVALLPLTAIVPSTSGRAAIALPLWRNLADLADDASVSRALAILIPTVILVSTIAALTGAGSHLIVNDILFGATGRRIGFGAWLLYGLPFAIVATTVASIVIPLMFLTQEQRRRRLPALPQIDVPWSREEFFVLAVAALMVALWLSDDFHGLNIATVAIVGALLLVSPFGPLDWKSGLSAVNWDLVVFVGCALLLGKALVDTGAAGWLTAELFSLVASKAHGSHLAIVAAVAALTLLSHLVITSHAARAAALTPMLLAFSTSVGIDPIAVAFIGTVGMNYCLTLPTSSKALLIYCGLDNGIRATDLLRLSAVLAPIHLALMLAFYFGYWRFVGLRL